MTNSTSKPSRSWLSFAVTTKAKQKIRATLGIDMDKDPKQSRKEAEDYKINLLKYISFDGKKAQLKLSKCCNPKFNEPIVAYRMKDGTITIHKKECPNIHTLDQTKKVDVKWNVPEKYIRGINVHLEDKLGMVEQILNTMVRFRINVLSINMKPHKKNIVFHLKIKADRKEVVDKAIEILKKIEHVTNVIEEKEEI